MSRYFVVGDIHGKAQMLEELMTEWDGKAQLVFLGDLIDRGENSKRSIEIVKDYVDHHGAVCLSGNHEYMFLAWLDNPEERYDHYRRNGGDTTINSLLGRPLDAPVDGIADAQAVESTVPDLVAFIRSLPFDYETETYYFVHAGVDLTLENWRETSDYQKSGSENHSMKRRIIQANGSSLAIHQSMDCSMSQSAPKIFGFQIRRWVSMGALSLVESSMDCSWMIKALSMTMSFIIQVFLPQTTEEAGMDIFHCKTPCFLI